MKSKVNILVIILFLMLSCSKDDSSNNDSTNDENEIDITIGQLAYYPLDGDLNDYSGNEINSVNENNMEFDEDGLGNANNAAKFDDNAYFELLSDNINFGTDNFSISLWVNSNSDETQMIFQKGGINLEEDPQYWLRLNDTNCVTFLTGDGDGTSSITSTSSSCVTDGEWHHLVVSRDGVALKIHLDNILISETEDDIEDVSNEQTLKFGIKLTNSTLTDSESFTGLMDEVRIYNKALSEEEIQELYNYLN